MSAQNSATRSSAPLNLEQEFLALTGRSLSRNPIPVMIGMALIATAALGSLPLTWVLGWLALSCAGVLGRVMIIGRVLRGDAYTDQQRLKTIYIVNFANATILCSSLVFFPSMSAIDAALMTLVIGFLAMGVVITTAGFFNACIPYISMALLALACGLCSPVLREVVN